MLIVGIVLGVLVIGLLVGIIVSHYVMTPADRRRLDVMSDRMLAELRMEAATRNALQAMREASRRAAR